jgi:hypothetical protein
MNEVDALAAMSPLKTGDLVLFAGAGSWLGRVRWLHRAAWSHIGMVLRRAADQEPLLWQAGHGTDRGMDLASLAARIGRFPGRIGARCLNRPLEPGHCERLEALRRDLCRPPELGLVDLIAAASDGWLGSTPAQLGAPTDAELVAAVYQGLGLLDDVEAGGRPSGRYRARHFAAGYGLELRHGYVLGPEIVLHEPDAGPGWSDLRPQPV